MSNAGIDLVQWSSWAQRCDGNEDRSVSGSIFSEGGSELSDDDVESFRKIEHLHDFNKAGRAQMGNAWHSLWSTVLARANELFVQDKNADSRSSNVIFNLLRAEGTARDLNN